jgi:hypothetical protein
MPVFVNDGDGRGVENRSSEEAQGSDQQVPALVDLLRNRSYAEIRQRMYDREPGSAWWTACRAELDLRNGQQLGEAALALSRSSEKMRASVQHFEQLTDTLQPTWVNCCAALRRQDEGSKSQCMSRSAYRWYNSSISSSKSSASGEGQRRVRGAKQSASDSGLSLETLVDQPSL